MAILGRKDRDRIFSKHYSLNLIRKLKNSDPSIAKEIQQLFYASYLVEAKLLGAKEFPPLNRKLEDYQETETNFYGFHKGEEITGIIELTLEEDRIEIDSLVVHPDHFRQGIAQQLLEFALESLDYNFFRVETGAENEPAIRLYKKLGFEEERQWDTFFGIRKVSFVLKK
ncbi:MAG: N-acetyltransferase [Bacteroidota bacterium]